MNLWDLFFTVFNGFAVLDTAAIGIVTGSTLILYLTLKAEVAHSTGFYVRRIISGLFTVTTIYYATRLVQAGITLDPAWPRVIAGYLLLEVFVMAIGVGLAISRYFAHDRAE